MSIEKRVEATAKNLEGKALEALGELTGDPQAKAEGEAKQVEAQKEHTVENMKEELAEKQQQLNSTGDRR
ncbi:CsbD family protein [Oxynema sp. CENA135]|uniref:CsbD family protein n=1 Tax=Oxynema sp. CENA135 TaxID=984206 RepID=UPI00190B8402|nr:CsbD family protein [Oxynema sp. CENA135]MBK4730034.1 CsbD family protein [Oxynema sp. CENA135]